MGTQCLEGYPEIAEKLQTVIQQELANNSITFDPASADVANNSDTPPQTQQSASERLSAKSLAIGTVIIGILVALLESDCTGQIYLSNQISYSTYIWM